MQTFNSFLSSIQSIDKPYCASFKFLEFTITCKSNSSVLIEEISEYFQEWRIQEAGPDAIEYQLYHIEVPEFDLRFQKYQEAPGKRIKEAFVDLEEGRLIRKIKTGVHFYQTSESAYAFGPLNSFPNQVVNFLNALFMEHYLDEDSMLFHAAGIEYNGQGIVLAAHSGKGKSTQALQYMNEGSIFISNDRVILKKNKDNTYDMIGVPKHPRVNPGTLINNPKLQHIVRDPERFESMPVEELRAFEEKYDVVISEVYGENKFNLRRRADKLIIIDWESTSEPTKIDQIDLSQFRDLLPAIMKKPSLMTMQAHERKKHLGENDYLKFLSELPILRVSGGRSNWIEELD